MGINLVIAVTDEDWFGMLRREPDLDEVNFWSPSAKRFRALQPGELFLFKLHAPYNSIVGGGIFTHATELPCSLAWEAFREANGVHSMDEMRARFIHYRRTAPDAREDFKISCRILTCPFFLDESDWFPVPASWSPRIVQLKTYNTDEAEGLSLWEAVQPWLDQTHPTDRGENQSRYGKPSLIQPRLGQGAFRVIVGDNYRRRCAVTQERTFPALEAAHIRPYSKGGWHEEKNGLLLRRDIHRLFDTGYVTVTPDLHFEVSRRIKDDYENGREYYALHGRGILAPKEAEKKPDPSSLIWHNENCYLR